MGRTIVVAFHCRSSVREPNPCVRATPARRTRQTRVKARGPGRDAPSCLVSLRPKPHCFALRLASHTDQPTLPVSAFAILLTLAQSIDRFEEITYLVE